MLVVHLTLYLFPITADFTCHADCDFVLFQQHGDFGYQGNEFKSCTCLLYTSLQSGFLFLDALVSLFVHFIISVLDIGKFFGAMPLHLLPYEKEEENSDANHEYRLKHSYHSVHPPAQRMPENVSR